MNMDNLEQLAQWLEAGAPHVVFNMSYYIAELDEVGTDYEERAFRIESDQKGLGDCGTVCCIAGYAAKMKCKKTANSSWPETRDAAINILGLEHKHDAGGMGHDLFDPDLAPSNCTPQQAAAAVRRVMAGEEPWA